jgi:hypothetical protein
MTQLIEWLTKSLRVSNLQKYLSFCSSCILLYLELFANGHCWLFDCVGLLWIVCCILAKIQSCDHTLIRIARKLFLSNWYTDAFVCLARSDGAVVILWNWIGGNLKVFQHHSTIMYSWCENHILHAQFENWKLGPTHPGGQAESPFEKPLP